MERTPVEVVVVSQQARFRMHPLHPASTPAMAHLYPHRRCSPYRCCTPPRPGAPQRIWFLLGATIALGLFSGIAFSASYQLVSRVHGAAKSSCAMPCAATALLVLVDDRGR